ncbi:MAG TPA: peptidoglycan DD-metalloendopeptidase family protein [Sporichthya sp.]|nr:peptidoglycan DD-metalloendopeptidase family protein [Sporichthya sp.]
MADNVSRAIRVLQQAGFKGERLKTAFGIVMRESGGNPSAHNTNRGTGDDSYGLAQINMLGKMGPARRKQFGIQSNQQLLDPVTNAKAFYRLSGGGKDFGPWGIGPNAYRAGAGMESIRPFIKRFPASAAGSGPPAPPPPRAPGDTPSDRPRVDPGFVLGLLGIVDRTGGDIGRDNGLGPYMELPGADNPLLSFLQNAQVAPPRKPVKFPPSSGLGKLQKAAQVRLPASFRGTHVTDGLGWGTRTALDIMGKAGSTVGAPVDGVVEYFHPTGAQGGGSMLIRGKNGKEYWLGHISHGVKPGTRVRKGQTVAVIADQHVSAPHVHIDERRAA